MPQNKKPFYLLALLVVGIWSTTFVSTKYLLSVISPMDTIVYRTLIAYIALFCLYPHISRPKSIRNELVYLALGLTGGTIYFLLQNYALSYTLASNASLLIATNPILTAVAAHFFVKNEKLTRSTVLGFVIAIVGTFLVIFNGRFVLRLNPLGDLLILGAALSWAVYSVITRNQPEPEHPVEATRKMFFYFGITLLPFMAAAGFHWDPAVLKPPVLANLLFVGIVASSLCFVLWSVVIRQLGAVTANNFIYLTPLITMAVSTAVLHEPVTPIALIGGAFILIGVYTAQKGKLK